MRYVRFIRHLWESAVFRKYVRSYVFIFLLPMLLIPVVFYAFNDTILRERIMDTQMSLVLQTQRAMDYEARRYQTIAVMLNNDALVQSLIDREASTLQPADTLEMHALRSQLSTVSSGAPGTLNIFIYFESSDYVVSSGNALPLIDVAYIFDVQSSPFSTPDAQQFRNLIMQRYTGDWLRMHYNNSECLSFVTNLSARYTGDRATLLVVMNPTYVANMLRPVSSAGDAWTCASSSAGTVLYQSTPAPIALDLSHFNAQSGQFMQDGYLVSYIFSELTDTIFVNAISEPVLFAPLRSLRSITFILLLICFVACGFLSYRFAVQNIMPLRQLVALTAHSSDLTDEYAVLQANLIEAADEKRRLINHELIAEQKKNDYENYRAMRHCASWADTVLPGHKAYCMARVVLIDYSENCPPADAMCLLKDAFDIGNGQMWKSKTFQSGQDLLIIIGLEDPFPAAQQMIIDEMRTAVQCVRDTFASDCLVGLSQIHPTQDDVGKMLRDMEIETQEVVHELHSETAVGAYQSSDVLSTAVKRFLTETAAGGDTEAAIARFSDEIRRAHALRNEKTESVAEDTQEDSAEYRLKQQIISIVEQQYADPSLNVSQVAFQLGRSSDYISKVFKQTSHIGLLEYIHYKRVRVAQDLLVNRPDMTISDIGTAVGYVSIDSFIRACKRVMNTTPGKYRENTVKSQNADV